MEGAKVRVSLRGVEFESSGSESFVREMYALFREVLPASTDDHASDESLRNEKGNEEKGKPNINLSVGTVATRLRASTGPDLAIAAAAYLQIVMGKESFSSQDLLGNMKGAKAHFKANMVSNFSKIIDRHVKNQKLNELSSSEYSLASTELERVRSELAAS